MLLAAACALAGCGHPNTRMATSARPPTEPTMSPMSTMSPDRDVTFASGELTLHGSLRLPVDAADPVPAALIIAGSGPTDRDGNSAVPGHTDKVDTYRWLADQLAARGYASLRYDKLGAGATGLGPYTPTDLGGLSFKDTFVRHAQDALAYLAAQPGVDARRLIVIGHSEGGMIALAVATDAATDAATAPKPAQLALLEPQYGTILGILGAQLEQKLREGVAAGALPAADGDALTA